MSLPDTSSCHHCHIHVPIPPDHLKRTHPLRSGPGDAGGGDQAPQPRRGIKKNVSFLYRKLNRQPVPPKHTAESTDSPPPLTPPSPPPPPPPPPPPTASSLHNGRLNSGKPDVLTSHSPATLNRPASNDQTPEPPDRRTTLNGCASLLGDSQTSRSSSSTGSLPSLPPLPVVKKTSCRERGLISLQAALLVGAYSLLLVLVVVIGVVLSQQAGSSGPAIRIRARPPTLSPRPSPRQPAPRPVPSSAPNFADYEYSDGLVPNPLTKPTFRPAPPRTAPPPQPTRTTAPLGRTDQDLTLTEEPVPRGRKEPAVKILRSWSHQNADGTYSWGYENSDGSFKNETKGTDCIVRGNFGYVDTVTGQLLTFPYETGIVCDPNEPDYYYDYDFDAGAPIDAVDNRRPLSNAPRQG